MTLVQEGSVRLALSSSWRVAAVLVAACLPYIGTPWFSFVAHDDAEHVDGHPVVSKGLDAKGVLWAFGINADPRNDSWLNWPLTWLSHMADVTMFGGWAGGHHIVNVFFHAINALLVLRLASLLGLAPRAATFVGCLFALHPAQVESVAWVSERKTVLSAGLMFAAMLIYLGRVGTRAGPRGWGAWLGWNITGLLALLAKPLAVTLPCVLLLFDVVLPNRTGGCGARAWIPAFLRCIAPKLLLFFLAFADCAWTLSAQREYGAVAGTPLGTRVASAVVAYATYVRVFFLPYDLGCHHPHRGMPTPVELLAATCTIGLCTFIAITAYRRKAPNILFGWLWFLGTLVPMVGLVQVGGNAWSDRYMYVPIVGLAIAFVQSIALFAPLILPRREAGDIDHACGRCFMRRSAVAQYVGLVWLLVLGFLSWRQADVWRNTGTLARSWIQANPRNSDAWNVLAVYLASLGDVRQAEKALRNAIELDADSNSDRLPDRMFNIGRLLLQSGRNAEAAQEFAAALQRDPEHVAALNGLGVALTRLQEYQRAADVFRKRLAKDPTDTTALVGLGNVHLLSGDPEQASDCFRRALAIDPSDDATMENLSRARAAAGTQKGMASGTAAATE